MSVARLLREYVEIINRKDLTSKSAAHVKLVIARKHRSISSSLSAISDMNQHKAGRLIGANATVNNKTNCRPT